MGAGGPRVKGVAFRTIDACYLDLRGPESHRRAHEIMMAEVRDAFKNSLVLAASWYPIAWYRDILRAFRAASHDGLGLPRMIGYESVRRDMASVYKQFFARFVSPQMLLSLSSKLFSTYYDTGKFELLDSHKGFVHVRLSGCLGWDANMWTEISGSCVAFLEVAGAKEVRLRTKSGGQDNDTETELEAHWV
jgi:hypothetical protein